MLNENDLEEIYQISEEVEIIEVDGGIAEPLGKEEIGKVVQDYVLILVAL